jgi:hypothetical protein
MSWGRRRLTDTVAWHYEARGKSFISHKITNFLLWYD